MLVVRKPALPGRRLLSQYLLTPRVSYGVARSDIVVTHLTTVGSSTDGATVATASKTPTANALQLIGIVSHNASSLTGPPTLTGCNLTWVQVATKVYTNTVRRLTVFRALGAAPSAGALTFDFGSDAQTSFVWSWLELTGIDTSGTNGSGAIVQSNSANAATGTTVAVTLSAFENAKNLHVAFVSSGNNGATTPDGNFTEHGDAVISTQSNSIESESAVNQITCSATLASTTTSAIIGIEVKAG